MIQVHHENCEHISKIMKEHVVYSHKVVIPRQKAQSLKLFFLPHINIFKYEYDQKVEEKWLTSMNAEYAFFFVKSLNTEKHCNKNKQ